MTKKIKSLQARENTSKWIEKEIKAEKSLKRKSLLMEAKEKFEQWEKTGEVDQNALRDLSVAIGLSSRRIKQKQKNIIEKMGNLELWSRADKGDVDALMELSIRNGITHRKDWERIKRETQEYDEE